MAIFGNFFASCVLSEPRAAGFRPASEIRTKATPCVEVWQTSNLRAKFRLDPFNGLATLHERYRQTDRQDRTGQLTDSIGRTVLHTVAQ